MDKLQIAIDFARKLQDIKGVMQVILFGSVAKGEDKSDSDIDLAIIHNIKSIEKLKNYANKLAHEKIQLVYVEINKLAKETELVSALTGEGLLLSGHPLKVNLDKRQLKPFILFIYDTTSLPRNQRMLLNRALHGSVSVSKHKNKIYHSESHGIIAQPGITKLTRACILAEPRKAIIIRQVLKRFGVRYKEEMIWK